MRALEVSPPPSEGLGAARGGTDRKPSSSPSRFRACSRHSGPRSDGSRRQEKRGTLGVRKRRGASAAAAPGHRSPPAAGGARVVRPRPEPGGVPLPAWWRRRGVAAACERRPVLRAFGPRPRRRGLRGAGVGAWRGGRAWAWEPRRSSASQEEARGRWWTAGLGPLPSAFSRGLGHPKPRREPPGGAAALWTPDPTGSLGLVTCGLTATDCTVCRPLA